MTCCVYFVTVPHSYHRWFSPGTPVSSTNKTDCHDITEILLKVALNTIPPSYHMARIKLTHLLSFYFFNLAIFI